MGNVDGKASRGARSEPWFADAVRLSHQALTHALLRDYVGAQVAAGKLNALSDDGGPIQVALMAWADAYVQYIKPSQDEGDPAEQSMAYLMFLNEDGELRDAEEVPPHVAWAGRWVVARGTMDGPTLDALWMVLLNMDVPEFQLTLGAVLTGVANSIRGLVHSD